MAQSEQISGYSPSSSSPEGIESANNQSSYISPSPSLECEYKEGPSPSWDPKELKAANKKWEIARRDLHLSFLKKSKSVKRKELLHWVNILLSNLRKVNDDIKQEGIEIDDLFKAEDDARKKFEMEKKLGVAQETQLHEEIKKNNHRLQLAIVKNQNSNFANYEKIQELVDEQEVKMLRKQS